MIRAYIRNPKVGNHRGPLLGTAFGSLATPDCNLPELSKLAHAHPSGNSGKSVVSGCTGSGYFFCQSLGGAFALFLELGELFGFPAGAAFGEDALQQLRAGLGGRAAGAALRASRR